MSTSPGRAPSAGPEMARARFSALLASQRTKIRGAWLAAAATVALTAVLALWIIPPVPIGMTQNDYSLAVGIAFLLALASALMGFVAVFARESATGETDLAGIWRSLFAGARRTRNRHQFYNRLARECARALRDRRSALSLVLVHVGPAEQRSGPVSPEALDHVATALAASVRSSDVMGIAGDAEIGVLAIDAGPEAREGICRRFERRLTTAFVGWTRAELPGGAPVVSLGASTMGPDDDPETLLAAARHALRPIGSRPAQAA